MLDIIVVADDLTGAADAGVTFAEAGSRMYLTSVDDLNLLQALDRPTGLSVYTRTRGMQPHEAAGVIERLAGSLGPLPGKHIYKKIDSCLRGNVGAEIDAALERFDLRLAFVAPAHPLHGRTTVNDVHYLKGVPVSETEMARDPISPVRESSLSGLLSGQSRNRVDRVDLEIINLGAEEFQDEVQRIIARGSRLVAFDTSEPGHLQSIARLALKMGPKVLLVGSAGLAGHLAAELASPQDTRLPPRPSGSLLCACGSTSQAMSSQIAYLLKHSTCRCSSLRVDELARFSRRFEEVTADWSAGRALCLLLRPEPRADALLDSPREVARGLGRWVTRIFSQAPPDVLFVSGGDTAEEVLTALGSRSVRLHAEILPGLIWGTIIGGTAAGRTIITKAGSFGSESVLFELYTTLHKEVES
ncbi:MAG: hypothetical protein K9K64_11450 [Desulfohalobiaceae bacterium]|nr:hypothetical protein [Desulfohalobiaceae bacterium]